MGTCVPWRQTNKGPLRVRIIVRRPLAGQIRKERQPLASRRSFSGFGQQGVIVRFRCERVMIPAQTACSGKHDTHHVPALGYCVRKSVCSAQSVKTRMPAGCKYYAGSAERDGPRIGFDGADAHCLGGLVATARDHRRPLSQASFSRCALGNTTRDGRAFKRGWKPAQRDIQPPEAGVLPTYGASNQVAAYRLHQPCPLQKRQ